ncbi:hypothetical protein FHS57_001204 [Runella defluvii]|uniref:Uncharacterized protein n=1 Tax=Runella defluvii TaxID=370973 RepID=A0A7W6EP49_9BACT|nr:hypothetical protein [Runella defluvii]
MKQTLTIALLFFVWQAGFCQVKKQAVCKDSLKVPYSYAYDSPHCSIGQKVNYQQGIK